jgi:hypothetical protein
MTTQKNEYGFPVSPAFEQSKTALERITDERCQGVSVPRVIDFMAWQLEGHRLFGHIRFDLNVATPQ